MTKIVLIGPTYPFRGGISHYTTLLCKQLRTRHNIEFLSFKRQYPKWLFPGKTDLDPSKTHIREDDTKRMLDPMNPFTWLQVAVRIIKAKPQLLIIPWWVSFWAPQFFTISLIVKLFSNTQILFLCHNVIEHESKWINKVLTQLVLKNGNFFIVHSKEDENNLINILPQAHVKRTFHPTYNIFNKNHFDPEKVKQRYGIHTNTLLFFGFVREYKGLKILLEAMPHVLDEIQATLLVVGEFWNDKQHYMDIVEKHRLIPNVIFVDRYIPNEEVGDFFSAADLVVQPYLSATGSGIIQIAFGFNKPVVATQVGALAEIVDNGKTGYLVPPGAPNELADAIIDFFQNDQKEEFKYNIEKENDKFSWDRIVGVIESFLER